MLVSHPLWVCGLKSLHLPLPVRIGSVTPFMGVWIEILMLLLLSLFVKVTPFMGVWIEMR